MGLDSYLTKVTYFYDKKRKDKLQIKGAPRVKTKRVSGIIEDIGYLRGADEIHQWFVDNVQFGVDDCREYEVRTDALKNLLELCEKIKTKPKQANKFLPTRNSFYDEYYFEHIDKTIDILKIAIKELEANDSISIIYRGSW